MSDSNKFKYTTVIDKLSLNRSDSIFNKTKQIFNSIRVLNVI